MQDFREFRKRPFHSHLGWKKGCKSEWPFGYQCLPGFREHAAAVGYLPFTVLKQKSTVCVMPYGWLQSGTYRLRYWNEMKLIKFLLLAAAVGYLPFTVLKQLKEVTNPIFFSAAVGYLPFTVLKPTDMEFHTNHSTELQSGTYRLRYWNWFVNRLYTRFAMRCSRVLTVYGIETI